MTTQHSPVADIPAQAAEQAPAPGHAPGQAPGSAPEHASGDAAGPAPAAELVVWRTLLRAQVRIARRLQADLLAEHDLPLAFYDVLTHLGEAPGGKLRMNDLADRVLLSRSGLTRLVDRLEREGLVVRETCTSDARGLYAALTQAGRARLDEAAPTYRRGVRDHVLSRLDDDDLRRFGRLLAKLADEPDGGLEEQATAFPERP
ncbi:MarR family winged helix-turn-helix transcriptional regulator [Actinomadura terrae]|uniref:MarR family winged helix-turn-helix transcriptional regulator n=1 Tax=Actinomadura terrae TaxID=604353 RepID=UPI001FA7C97D|nr:MarR family winged helix-turn-helix transcriptional regulator [Actinomadura terrae]